jgi:molybdenum cofactor cytidylyltransferase
MSAGPNPAAASLAAVVLAAGSSRRFGADNKLLAAIDGRPLVARVVAAIEGAGIGRVIVVTGHDRERVAAALAGAGRTLVHNGDHDAGMGTSIAAGIAALGDDVDGALIAQGDMPAVDSALIAALCRAFLAHGCDRIVHPVLADGRQGNPVIWPRRLFADLARLNGDKGGKRLIEAEAGRTVGSAVAGDGAAADIDTPEQLAAYLAARASRPR